jgi:hypothetical protein
MQVALIPREAIQSVLPYVMPMIARSLPYTNGRFTLSDLQKEILEQNKALWVVFDAGLNELRPEGVFLTSIGDYPSLRVLRIDFLGGQNLSDWIHVAQWALQRFAHDHGCARLEMTGRLGWLPTLEKLGWKMAFITLEKDIEHVERQRVDEGDRAADHGVKSSQLSSAAV